MMGRSHAAVKTNAVADVPAFVGKSAATLRAPTLPARYGLYNASIHLFVRGFCANAPR
jgi:hypothetical protein